MHRTTVVILNSNHIMRLSSLQHAGVLFFALVLLAAAGCEQSFDPKGPYQKRLVVYSILTSRSDSQFVRIYTSYNPSGFDPLQVTTDTYIRNAQVKIADDSVECHLQGIVIPRSDKSRYTSDVFAYVGYPFPLRPNKSYTLTITSADGNAVATAVMPGNGRVDANNPYVLKAPEKYDEPISARVWLSSVTLGYLLRLYLEFDASVGSGMVHVRTEVPQSIITNGDLGTQLVYPRMVRRIMDYSVVYEVVYFDLDAYKYFFDQLKAQYADMRLTSATYILTQMEPNLYKYFNIANGFQDEFSIRTDLPDFSSIEGGFGVFGAMADDSVVVDLR